VSDAAELAECAPEPRIWAAVIRGLELPLAEHDLNFADLLAAAGIAMDEIERAQGGVSLRKYLTFVETAAQAAGDPLLGLRMARSTGPDALGAVGFLFLSSRTLQQALSNLCTYANLMQDGARIQFVSGPRELTCSYHLHRIGDVDCRQDVEFSLGLVCRLIRIYAGPSAEISAVAFRHAPAADRRTYERLLGAPVYFEQDANCISLPARTGQIEGMVLDHSLCAILRDFLDERLERRGRLRTFSDQVDEALYAGAIAPPLTARKIAQHLGVSEATLHRRLRAEGLTPGRLIDSRNFELAQEYLSDSALPITRIALLVGYSESASFTRAFRRWSGGLTPSQFRKRTLERRRAP